MSDRTLALAVIEQAVLDLALQGDDDAAHFLNRTSPDLKWWVRFLGANDGSEEQVEKWAWQMAANVADLARGAIDGPRRGTAVPEAVGSGPVLGSLCAVDLLGEGA